MHRAQDANRAHLAMSTNHANSGNSTSVSVLQLDVIDWMIQTTREHNCGIKEITSGTVSCQLDILRPGNNVV
jgi:hypothetical protein